MLKKHFKEKYSTISVLHDTVVSKNWTVQVSCIAVGLFLATSREKITFWHKIFHLTVINNFSWVWHSLLLLLSYIANCSRWKDFAVVELNCNSLENICGWPFPSLLLQLMEKFRGYQLIHENCKTFPPWTICNIRYLLMRAPWKRLSKNYLLYVCYCI